MYDFLLVAGVVLWLGLGAWYLRQPAASAYHPVTWYFIFQGVLFTLRPILARVYGFDQIYRAAQFMPSAYDKIVVLLGADVAFVVFVVLCVRIGREPFTAAPGARQRDEEPRFTPSLWVTLALCLPPALLSLAATLGERFSDTATTMIRDARSGIVVNTTNNGYFTDALLMLMPIIMLVAWAGRFRWWSLIPLALFVIAKAGTGGRWPFVMTTIAVSLYWMYGRRLRWFPPRAVLAAVPLVGLFTIIGADRGAGLRAVLTGQQVTTAENYFDSRPLEPMDYANMEFFEFLVHIVPAKTGTYDYFLSNLQVLTEPVPRVLWPGKPLGAPITRFYIYDYAPAIGMTWSIAGVGWLEAGWLGIVAWTALFAWFYGALYRWFVRSDQNRYKTAVYMLALAITLQTFRDGLLLTILKTSFFPMVPILVWRALRFLDAPAAVARRDVRPT